MMPFFSWRHLLKRRTEPVPETREFVLPYELTPSEWNVLREWRDSTEFEVFADLIDEVAKLSAEALLASADPSNTRFLQGVVHGLRKSVHLVDEIQNQKEAHQNDRSRRERSRERATTALIGTPAYRRTTSAG